MHPCRSLLVPVSTGLLVFSLALRSPAQFRVPDDFATIQAAVDASSSGGSILIRTGRYTEQVLIANKTLTLRGESGATLVAPALMVQTLLPFTERRPVLTVRTARVHLQGLAFDGLQSGLVNPDLTGVYYLASSGVVQRCSFTGFRRATPTPDRGFAAIWATNPEEAGEGMTYLHVVGNSVRDSEFGIYVAGDLENLPAFDPTATRMHATIQHNDLVAVDGWSPQQVGIISAWGVRAVIVDNDVSGFAGGSATAPSIGISIGRVIGAAFRHSHTVVGLNRLDGNTIGILSLFSERARIGLNRVVAGPASVWGIGVSGEHNILGANLVDMRAALFPGSAGILMLGLEGGGPGFALGKAIDTLVIVNTVLGGGTPIWVQTGSSGTRLIGNTVQ